MHGKKAQYGGRSHSRDHALAPPECIKPCLWYSEILQVMVGAMSSQLYLEPGRVDCFSKLLSKSMRSEQVAMSCLPCCLQ